MRLKSRSRFPHACTVVAKQVESLGFEPVTVPITYYRDQVMYDEFGRDPGPYGQANATPARWPMSWSVAASR